MMSRRLFFKAMREDLRHKMWMSVLFALISFLTLPMAWLLVRSNLDVNWAEVGKYSDEEIRRELVQTGRFWGGYLTAMGGILAMAAGVVSGLFSFQFVFHKNRVDTYHSLPVKRGVLYGLFYLDGIVVWLVPYLICLIMTLLLAGGFVGRLGGAVAVGGMCALTLRSLLVILTIFCLVYHLVLVAVMMSGNILNTLVNMMLLGFGAVGLYGMVHVFFEQYMSFYARSSSHEIIGYFSPLFSALNLLIFAEEMDDAWSRAVMIAANLLLAAAMGVCSWLLYRKRASELAEQGVRNKVVTTVLRVTTGVVAGMIGWMIFLMMTDNMTGFVGLTWRAFGAVLISVFAFGVLDVVFCMEFKAFFYHRYQMAGTVIVVLILCVAFNRDWFGYDKYLPRKDEIAQVAIFDNQFSNRQIISSWASREALENMCFTDREAEHVFLEQAVEWENWVSKNSENRVAKGYEDVDVKVTLKNGMSYYRSYKVPADKDVLWPFFTSEEYLEYTYLISDEDAREMDEMILLREGRMLSVENAELVMDIVRAYNQYVLEHTEELLLGEGQPVVNIQLEGSKQIKFSSARRQNFYSLYIYSNMEDVIRIIEQAGYGEWVRPIDASSVEAIRFEFQVYSDEEETEEEIIARAIEKYGVNEEVGDAVNRDDSDSIGDVGNRDESDDMGDAENQEIFDSIGNTENREESDGVEDIDSGASFGEMDTIFVGSYSEAGAIPIVQITDRAEIEELLPYVSYVKEYNTSILRKKQILISVIDTKGNIHECYIQKDGLSMKYIRRFVDAVRMYGKVVE